MFRLKIFLLPFDIFVTSVLLLFHLLHSGVVVVVSSYGLNPKAIHPNGRLPTSIAKARQLTNDIHREIFFNINPSNEEDDDTEDTASTIVLVDGNNIRNAYGYENMSALQLTNSMMSSSCWANNNNDEMQHGVSIICIWDGGSKCTSQQVDAPSSSSQQPHQLVVYSGPDGNADDLIVQCCAFISSSSRRRQVDYSKVIVFTSDANLANRCQMQLIMGEEEESDGGDRSCLGKKRDHHIYHSIHLCLLLEEYDKDGNVINNGVSNNSHGFAPDWERSERRKSVEELQTYFDSTTSSPQMEKYSVNDKGIECIRRWIKNGLNGITIGRVTKGGSILYKMS